MPFRQKMLNPVCRRSGSRGERARAADERDDDRPEAGGAMLAAGAPMAQSGTEPLLATQEPAIPPAGPSRSSP